MNPSYNSGGASDAGGASNIPGVKPGIIASGPEPADTPNASMPNTGTTPGVIASGPEPEVEPRPIDTPAGLSMNSSRMPSGGRPMNMPVNNDIVLNTGDTSKKPNRGILIGGIVAVVVLAIVAVVVGVMMGSGNNGGSTVTVVDETTALNNFTNYMLFGDINSDKSINSVNFEDARFMEVSMKWAYNEQQDYFSQLKQYLNDLRNNNTNSSIVSSINNLNSNLPLFERLSAIAYTDALWTIYLEDGVGGVQNYTAEVGNLELTDNISADVATVSEELGTIAVKLYTEYKNKGCIKDDTADEDCVSSAAESNENLIGMINKMTNLKVRLRNNARALGMIMFLDARTINGFEADVTEEGVTEDE